MSDDWEFGTLDSMAEEDDPILGDELLEAAILELIDDDEEVDEIALREGLRGLLDDD